MKKPQNSPYYQCVEDNFKTLEQVYDEHFVKQHGFFRPYVIKVIYRYLRFIWVVLNRPFCYVTNFNRNQTGPRFVCECSILTASIFPILYKGGAGAQNSVYDFNPVGFFCCGWIHFPEELYPGL